MRIHKYSNLCIKCLPPSFPAFALVFLMSLNEVIEVSRRRLVETLLSEIRHFPESTYTLKSA